MAIRKQAAGRGVREYVTADDGAGGYHTLLAAIMERWVQDARGHITDCPCEHDVQSKALAALVGWGSVEQEAEGAILRLIAGELEIPAWKILSALRERVEAA